MFLHIVGEILGGGALGVHVLVDRHSKCFLDANRVELRVVADAQVVTTGLVLVWERIR